jgi:osmotically inducible protein OsmC
MTKRTSEAQWEGTLAEGKGRFWTASGEVSGVYTQGTRFGDQPGTNPEELIGAAHASCFSMALAADLEKAGHRPEGVRTVATVTLQKGDAGYEITGIDLDTQAQVPGIDESELRRIADGTGVSCPVSKALAAVPITVQAALTQ